MFSHYIVFVEINISADYFVLGLFTLFKFGTIKLYLLIFTKCFVKTLLPSRDARYFKTYVPSTYP